MQFCQPDQDVKGMTYNGRESMHNPQPAIWGVHDLVESQFNM